MNDSVRADGDEMSRLAHRLLGHAQGAFSGVDFEAAAAAVAGSEFEQVLRQVSESLAQAGNGASERLQNISALVKSSAGALTGQDVASGHSVARAASNGVSA